MVQGDTVRESPDWLSTGQAAKFCSVKPDTILKWIKRGKVRAERTGGGHYRIERKVLEPLILTPQKRDGSRWAGRPGGRPLRCWEYLGRGGRAPDGCNECIVYRSRASWCFQLVELGRELGHVQRFCAESCEDCSYYQQVQGLATRVLVVTPDGELRETVLADSAENVHVRLASSGYEASSIIHEFRPNFVIVDRDLVKGAEPQLLQSLLEDTRVPGVRLVLAVGKGKAARARAAIERDIVVGVIEKPFGSDRIASVIEAFPVESGAPDEDRS